jgi:UDP-glucose 4-epimerase
MFRGTKAVVTGGAGFIGSHIADHLVSLGAEVLVYDNLATGFRQFVNPKAEFVEADLLDQAKLDAAMKGASFVFHLAANADIRDGLSHPRKDVEQNVVVTQNVLEAMRAHGVKKIAFSSTGSVYGEASVFPTPENAPFPVQTSLYATSKVAAEGLLSSYALGYGFESYIFRFVSILGPRYSHGHVYDFWRALRKDSSTLHILGNGKQLKSYCHVDDCVRAIFSTIEKSQSPDRIHIHNIGRPDMLEVNTSVGYICRELGLSPKFTYSGGERGWVGDSPKILLDTSRLTSLGWAPTFTLEAAVIDTLKFLVANAWMADRH